MRLLLSTLAALAALAAGPGCGSVGPSDEPLPTVAELRAEFDRQPEGRGLVRDGGQRYETSAAHHTSVETGPAGSISTFRANLVSEDPAAAITVLLHETDGADLRAGDELNARFIYGSTSGDGSRGGGVLGITAVEGGRIEGVFAADLAPGGLVPDFRRIRGAFHAVPDSTN